MVRITSYINLLQNQIGIDKKSALGLKLGELLTAKILKVSSELALLELKGQKILAELKTNLQPGDEVKVRVAGEQQNRVILKIIDDSTSTSNPLDQLLNKSGVQPDKEARTALDFLLKNNLPVTPQTLRALITDQKMPLLQIISKIFYQGTTPISANQNSQPTQQATSSQPHPGTNTPIQQNNLTALNQLASSDLKSNLITNNLHADEALPTISKSAQVLLDTSNIERSVTEGSKDTLKLPAENRLEIKNPQHSQDTQLSNNMKSTAKSLKPTQKQTSTTDNPRSHLQESRSIRDFKPIRQQVEIPRHAGAKTHNPRPIKSRLLIKGNQIQQPLLERTTNQQPINLKETFKGEAQIIKPSILLNIKNSNNLLLTPEITENQESSAKEPLFAKRFSPSQNIQGRNTAAQTTVNQQSPATQRPLEQLGLILNPERTPAELVRGLKSLIQNLGLLKKGEESAESVEKPQLPSLTNSSLSQEQKEGVRELLDKFLALRLRQKSDDLLLHLDIPVLFNQPGTAFLQIKEDHTHHQEDTRQRPLNIFFNLDIESLGKLRILILLSGKEMNCQFSAQLEKTRLLLRQHIPELKDRLEEMSFQVTGLGVSTLREEESDSLPFSGQIDFRV